MANPYGIENFNIGTAIQEGYERGQQQAKQRRFADLAGQAFGAPEDQQRALLQQAVAIDPTAGFALQKQIEDDSGRQRTQLYNIARGLKAAHGQNPVIAKTLYERQFAPGLRRMGFDVPEVWDEAAIMPVVDQTLAAFEPSTDQGTPGAVRQFQYLTQGLSPEDAARARRIELGLDPRAVTGAPKQLEITGNDGRKRQGYFDPATRTTFVLDEASESFRPLASGERITAEAPAAAGHVSLEGLSPEQNQAVAALIAGLPVDQADAFVTAINSRQRFMSGGAPASSQSPVARPGLGVSRTPEEEAYAKELAQQQAQIDTYRTRAGLEAEGAAQKAFAEETAKAQAAIQNLQGKKAVQANDVLALLDAAEPLVKRSTGSGLGAAADRAAAFVGASTEGADAIAALRPIAAALIGNVPRMEGPQSDADRRLYEQAAGDVANATTPITQRLASIQTMRNLQQKYARFNQGEQAPSTATPRTIRYNAQGQRIP